VEIREIRVPPFEKVIKPATLRKPWPLPEIPALSKEGNELLAMTVASIKTLRSRK
jgi:hypothetical protein